MRIELVIVVGRSWGNRPPASPTPSPPLPTCGDNLSLALRLSANAATAARATAICPLTTPITCTSPDHT